MHQSFIGSRNLKPPIDVVMEPACTLRMVEPNVALIPGRTRGCVICAIGTAADLVDLFIQGRVQIET